MPITTKAPMPMTKLHPESRAIRPVGGRLGSVSMVTRSAVARGRGAAQTVVDGDAQPFMRDRGDGDRLAASGIETVQIVKQVRCRFDKILVRGQVEVAVHLAETQPHLARLPVCCVQAD